MEINYDNNIIMYVDDVDKMGKPMFYSRFRLLFLLTYWLLSFDTYS